MANNFKIRSLQLLMGDRQSLNPELAGQSSPSIFQLRKSNSQCATSIHVNFSSQPQPQSQPIPTSSNKTLPIFNTDRCHFTPAFILPIDSQRYSQNLQIYLNIHNRKTCQMQQQKTQIFVPKPSKNNSFCCVCKTPFEDYLTHVSLPKHRLLMKQSEFYTRIHEICDSFPRKDVVAVPKKKKGRPVKTKLIAKISSCRSLSGKDTSGEESLKAEDLAQGL